MSTKISIKTKELYEQNKSLTRMTQIYSRRKKKGRYIKEDCADTYGSEMERNSSCMEIFKPVSGEFKKVMKKFLIIFGVGA